MNILILGSGGREHTIAWKLSQSPKASKIFVAPGNAGTEEVAQNVNISLSDFEKLGDFCLNNQIELVVVGPEAPLVAGVVDFFKGNAQLKNIPIVGPDKSGARLEGSKDFSKAFMQKYNIPTATAQTFDNGSLKDGVKYLENHSLPIVLKADGLAAGKGVIILDSVKEAQETLVEMVSNKKFGEASSKVLVEQFLTGIEVSVFVLTDGDSYVVLPEAKDYKRIGEGDTGPNTGGMGAISPVPFADATFMEKVEQKVIKPTIQGLKTENIDYIGFLFIGLMNVNGEPYVIEYNCRLGDPETEAILPRIETDLVEILLGAGKKELKNVKIKFSKKTAATTVLVAGGYPEEYDKGDEIKGIQNAENVVVFHAGTTKNADGKVVTNGGRVIAVTGLGDSMEEALKNSQEAAEKIDWKNRYYRKDIGKDLLNYLSFSNS